MAENSIIKRFFLPGPRGRLRWIILAIIVLFFAALKLDLIGFKNPAAAKADQLLSQIPVVRDWRIFPNFEHNPEDNSWRLNFKNIQEIELGEYGPPFRLGLDLQGGTHLVYQADVSEIEPDRRADSLAGVRDVIERRVNVLGVSEPLVQTNKTGRDWRVIVELAGVYDVNQAIEKIGETPLLEFKKENPAASQLTAEERERLAEANQEVKSRAEEILGRAKQGDDFAGLAEEYSEDLGSRERGGLYPKVVRGSLVPEYEEAIFNSDLKAGEVYPELVESQYGYHIIKKEGESETPDGLAVDSRHILFKKKTPTELGIKVEPEWEKTFLTGEHLEKAVFELGGRTNTPEVRLKFNREGADLFAEITKENQGKLVAIFLDGYPISIPRVNEPILSGEAVITGNFTPEEAKLLARRLNAGALPVPINLISQTTVGATLGGQSVKKSLEAAFWGLLLVALFMIFYYRLPGVLSVFALIIYTAVVLAVFKLVPVTLTLAGISGFILSIGMAVDANVLIFERFKEERRQGRNPDSAVEEGFRRAWSSIRDSNISSLITCGILFWFGFGIIKGFAVTLAIGIVISMFSAIIITKQFLRLVIRWRLSRWNWLFGAGLKIKD